MRSQISAVKYKLASNKVTNEDLAAQYPEWPVDKIFSKTGIKSRYIASDNEFNIDLAELAANELFAKDNIDRNTIDFIILCTQTPKYLIPTGACILQEKLKLRNDIGAFDINLGCSGYVYSLNVAHSLIQSCQAKKVLVLTADTYSKLISQDNRQLRTIFGDGASATLVELSIEDGLGIKEFCFYTDGSGYNKLISRGSGLQGLCLDQPYRPDLEMVGPDIFNFTIKCVPELVGRALEKNKLTISEIDYCIFHQANEYMLSYLRDKIGFSNKQFIIDMLDFGNTVSSSIPIVLSRFLSSDRYKKTSKLLLVGFGVGLSCGAVVIA